MKCTIGFLASACNNIMMVLFALGAVGCGNFECGDYREAMSDGDRLDELVEWSDSQIFTRRFERADFMMGKLSGPGKYFGSIDPTTSRVSVLPWLEGYEIRFLGPDKFSPNAIFVGWRRYQGLVITKGDFAEAIEKAKIESSDFEVVQGRVGLMCNTERGLSPIPVGR